MINWNKYFDHIFCTIYVNNGRYNSIVNELKRVGIIDSGIFDFIYLDDNMFTNDIFKIMPKSNIYDRKCIRQTYAQYKIWNTSKILGFKKILILEDDIRFLKDINEIENILDTTQESDITMYDYCFVKNTNGEINTTIFYHSSCYSLNETGINVILYNFEQNNFPICDRLFMNSEIINATHTFGNKENGVFVLQEIIYNKYKLDNIGSYSLGLSTKRLAIQVNKDYLENKEEANDYMEF